MKKAILCAVVLLAFGGSAWAAEEPAVEVLEVGLVETQNAEAVETETAEPTMDVEGLEAAETPVAGFWNLPSCGSVHGTFCSQPGSYRRCLLAPYEPEICVCQSNKTWKCFW